MHVYKTVKKWYDYQDDVRHTNEDK
jgi:hypothetical protein